MKKKPFGVWRVARSGPHKGSLLAGPNVSFPSVARVRDEPKELLPCVGSYPKVMIFYVESCLMLTFLSRVPSLNGKVAARSPSLMGALCHCVFVDGMNFKKHFM